MTVYLQTERLILRQFTMADAQDLCMLNSDPEVMRFLHAEVPTPIETIRTEVLPRYLSYYERTDQFGYWAALEKPGEEFIGWFHLRPLRDAKVVFRPGIDRADEIDLGYRLVHWAWGRGFATEAARALVAKGFTELHIRRITAVSTIANQASIRVIQKAGLLFAEKYFHEGLGTEIVKYGLDRSDYLSDISQRK